MKKPKVLMIGPDRSVHGGISGVVNNYYDAGLDEKTELCYIGTMVEGSKLRKLWQAFTAFCRFACKLPFYEIVHVNVASDASYVRKSFFIRLAKLFGKKIVIHQHGGDFENYYAGLSDRGKAKVRKVLSMGDVFLVLSPVLQEFFGDVIDDKSKIVLFPNTIKISEMKSKRYGQHKLLFLGRICKEKGIHELLTVMSCLKEQFPDIRLYLGGIWEEEAIQREAEAQSDHVEWIGWVTGEEKEKYLQECDIFVLPTYFEGQPVSVLEAMSHSCAVVASDVGGIPQMITSGQNGILIKPQNESMLQNALKKILSDAQLCEALGKEARKKVKKDFSMEQSMERLLDIYAKLISQ